MGSTSFRRFVDEDAPIIDKTLFIEEFLREASLVSVILRPRRFGKSLNLSMLQLFLDMHSKETYSEFFESSILGKQYPNVVASEFRQYPVVHLSLKDCGGDSWSPTYSGVWRMVTEMFRPHLRDLNEVLQSLDKSEVNYSSLTPPLDREIVVGSLRWLMNALHRKHGKRIIVLVDEYDAPLNKAYRRNYYKEASDFFGRFFSCALKDNDALQKACLVGIVEATSDDLLSPLNNMNIFTVANEEYSRHFGFSNEEIRNFLQNEDRAKEAAEWYNGYRIGSQLVVNPWSFMNWVRTERFESYWVRSAYIESLSTVLEHSLSTVLLQTFSLLYSADAVAVRALSSSVNYADSSGAFADLDSILHFLVLTGYLTYLRTDACKGAVRIPNFEVRQHWHSQVVELVQKSNLVGGAELRDSIVGALCSSPFTFDALDGVMRRALMLFSFMDTRSENSYHCFFLGCFGVALHDAKDVFVKSNGEAGDGRFEILITFQKQKRAVIFELKKSRSQDQLDVDASAALNQIFEKRYADGFDDYHRLLVGVSFHQKQMSALKSACFLPGIKCSK